MLMVRRDKARLARVLFALGLTVIVAFALYWGFLKDGPSLATNGMRAELDFTKLPDGPPPDHFDTGQPALVSQSLTDPGSSFIVRDAKLTYKPTTGNISAAYFSTPDMGQPISSLGARFVFEPPQGGGSGAITLVISRNVQDSIPQTVPPIPIHFVATAANWNLSVAKDSGSPLELIAGGDLTHPLEQDNVSSYTVSLYLDGGQVTLDLPDGTRQIIKDARISEWAGNFATFEVYSNDGLTDSIGGFQQIWADSTVDK